MIYIIQKSHSKLLQKGQEKLAILNEKTVVCSGQKNTAKGRITKRLSTNASKSLSHT